MRLLELARICLTVIGSAACGYAAMSSDTKTLSIAVPEGRYDLVYDSTRIQSSDLQKWVSLSPALSQNNGLLVPENVLSCDKDDPRYTHCGSEWSIWLNQANAIETQKEIRKRLDSLRPEQYPRHLTPIVNYFRLVQAFALWRNEQEITFFQTRDVADLERQYEPLQIDPKRSCAVVLSKIRSAPDQIAEWRLAVYDWHNCVHQQFDSKVGPYPQDVWDRFLQSRGIQEHLVINE